MGARQRASIKDSPWNLGSRNNETADLKGLTLMEFQNERSSRSKEQDRSAGRNND